MTGSNRTGTVAVKPPSSSLSGFSAFHHNFHDIMRLTSSTGTKNEGENLPVAIFCFEEHRKFIRVSEDYEVRLGDPAIGIYESLSHRTR